MYLKILNENRFFIDGKLDIPMFETFYNSNPNVETYNKEEKDAALAYYRQMQQFQNLNQQQLQIQQQLEQQMQQQIQQDRIFQQQQDEHLRFLQQQQQDHLGFLQQQQQQIHLQNSIPNMGNMGMMF